MTDNLVGVRTRCPNCNEYYVITVNEKDYKDWANGKLAQQAFPYLNADQREQLISGYCPTCWGKVFENEE